MPQLRKCLPPLLISLLLGACSVGEHTPLPNYIERLGRSLDVQIEPADATLPRLPRPRDLEIELQQDEIDLLDLLAMNDCALQVTVARANSSLGKVATASQRLLLELEFLELAPACMQQLRVDQQESLADTLEAAVERKQQQLPARIWNATLGGPEMREFWKPPASLQDYPEQVSGEPVLALARLKNMIEAWLQGDYSAGRDTLELTLGQVRLGDGGALVSSQEIQASALLAATNALRERMSTRPMCFRETATPEARIVETVALKFFVGEVQPWLVRLHKRQQALLPALLEIESKLAPAAPPAYEEWRQHRDTILASAKGTARRHALALSEFLAACGLAPGSRSHPN